MSDRSEVDINAVAIIGMAGRFPGAADVEELWSLFARGGTAIRTVDEMMLRQERIDVRMLSDESYVARAAWIDDVDQFDAGLFNIAPKEAAELDPQQRLLLQCAYHAVESAGYAPRALQMPVGVYIAMKRSTYCPRNLQPFLDTSRSLDDTRIELAADKSFAASRLAHALDLDGPVLSVDTACSSSLVAVHLACRALIGYECDMALAGGANITVPQRAGYRYLEGGTFSRDGACRAFDAAAGGTVLGNGVGVIVLRRLADALEAGDNILAVVRGTAINNDGARKVGFWAPGVRGQMQVIVAAQQFAGVAAGDITYVEAHGMGTALGDSAEVMALTDAFRSTTDECYYCALTSSKPNIGHLEAAGGITSLIKLVLAQQRAQIPPSLGVTVPNPDIDWASSPFYLNRRLQEWRPGASGRRIGAVSSFGIGGTNAHAIIEQAPDRCVANAADEAQLWPISAMSAAQCRAMTERIAAYAHDARLHVGEIAYTLQTGRERFAHRGFVVVTANTSVDIDADPMLSAHIAAPVEMPQRPPRLAFLFAGEVDGRPRMLADLYRTNETFRTEMEACVEHLRALLPAEPDVGWPVLAQRFEQMPNAGALLSFVAQYSLARYFEAVGVQPDMLFGDGAGAYVAAAVAGVFSPKDALRLLAMRSDATSNADSTARSRSALEAVELRVPRIALVCDMGGCPITDDDATDVEYWVRQALSDQSGAGLAALRDRGIGLLLDLGPGISLSQAALQNGFCTDEVISVTKDDTTTSEESRLLTALGRMWQRGIEPDWSVLHRGKQRRRVWLPGYAFARTRYWRDPPSLHSLQQPSCVPSLPMPHGAASGHARYRAPVTAVERSLAHIWCELLGFERVGLDDNFFALGGHSLTATQMATRIRAQLGVDLKLDAIFDQPTIAALAARIAEQQAADDQAGMTAIAAVRQRPPVMSLAQERLWLVDRMEGPGGSYNEGCALLIEGRLHVATLESALRALMVRHETLRSAFPCDGDHPRLTILPDAVLSLKLLDIGADAGSPDECFQQALALLGSESQRPFDLASGPLFRCVVLRLDAERHVLGVFVHHTVCDGLSMEIACRDLAGLYEAGREQRPAVLPSLPVQYADFAAWQRSHLTPERLAPHLEFWRERLRGATAMQLAEMKGDRRLRKGAVYRFTIPIELMQRLSRAAREMRTTPFVVLVGCFELLLAARSSGEDVVVTTPITERQQPELENLIGLFVNSLVLRQAVQPAWSISEYIAAVHATHRAALAHRIAPFEQVLDVAGRDSGDRAAISALLSQARFVYLEGAVEKLAFEQLVATPLPLSRRVAKFELLLTVQRGEQQCRADVEYRTELFSAAYIVSFAEQFVRLVERIVTRPEMRLGAIIAELGACDGRLAGSRREHPGERQGAGSYERELVAERVQ